MEPAPSAPEEVAVVEPTPPAPEPPTDVVEPKPPAPEPTAAEEAVVIEPEPPATEEAPVAEPTPAMTEETAALAIAPQPTRLARRPLDPQQVARGRDVYLGHCDSCHGPEGRGDGPMRDTIVYPPSDLTVISERLGGEFAAPEVAARIDGRVDVYGHGHPEQPVWGTRFRADGPTSGELEALLTYLESIQRDALEVDSAG